MKMEPNVILASDSYKLGPHWKMYPEGTEYIEAYFESRPGAKFDYTAFVGLQVILIDMLEGEVVTRAKIEEAAELSRAHFGTDEYFNREMWEHILKKHKGRLPIRIDAVAEGTPVPTSNILMRVINTDPKCAPLTGHLESLLTHVWYPSTVGTLSRATLEIIRYYLRKTSMSDGGLMFMLHDFGYRGAACEEAAVRGGLAHIMNSWGTDTPDAMRAAKFYYGASYDGLAYSVAATEHSIMTSLGEDGEFKLVEKFLHDYALNICSVVADSYNYYRFVKTMGTEPFRALIKARTLPFVIRPDSITPKHTTPEDLMLWTLEQLEADWGVVTNEKGYKTINAPIKVLWGDGIDTAGIDKILALLTKFKYATDNIATFGMGGGLLQKVNRDTQRFAFKSCAQCRNGVWYDIFKKPLDPSKASKKGHLALMKNAEELFFTAQVERNAPNQDLLINVFLNGEITRRFTWNEVRANAKLT